MKVHGKGIVILPKKLREALGIKEGDELVAEVNEDKIVLRVLKPVVVDVDPDLVEGIIHEEYELENHRYTEVLSSEKASGRR